MRYLITILTLIPLLGNSQTVTLPAWVVDSLIFEAHAYRACDSLQVAQQVELTTLGSELLQTRSALNMQQRQNETCENLVKNSRKETASVKQESKENDRRLKKRIVTLGKVSVLELAIIIILIL